MKEKTEVFMNKIHSRVLSHRNKNSSASDLLSRIQDVKSNKEIIHLINKLEYHSKIFHKEFVINSHRKFLKYFLVFGRKLILAEIRRYVDPIVARQEYYNHLNNLSIIEIIINYQEHIKDLKLEREINSQNLDELSEKIMLTCKEVDTYLFQHAPLFNLINSLFEQSSYDNKSVFNQILVINSNKGILPIILSKKNIIAIGCDDSESNIELSINNNILYNSNAIFFLKSQNYNKIFVNMHFDIIIIELLEKKITINDIIMEILKNSNNSKHIIIHVDSSILSDVTDITITSTFFDFLIEKIESLGFKLMQTINYVILEGGIESNLYLLDFVKIK